MPEPVPELSSLTSSERPDLSHSRLSGPIPDLSALTNLQESSPGYNALSGPVSHPGALSELESLASQRNKLSRLSADAFSGVWGNTFCPRRGTENINIFPHCGLW
ncbi:MAG: hypothetical protein OXF86_01225 [Caldilineaceae bacterium]|nr:hypothetical protein [Caldilineaceae bacterium]